MIALDDRVLVLRARVSLARFASDVYPERVCTWAGGERTGLKAKVGEEDGTDDWDDNDLLFPAGSSVRRVTGELFGEFGMVVECMKVSGVRTTVIGQMGDVRVDVKTQTTGLSPFSLSTSSKSVTNVYFLPESPPCAGVLLKAFLVDWGRRRQSVAPGHSCRFGPLSVLRFGMLCSLIPNHYHLRLVCGCSSTQQCSREYIHHSIPVAVIVEHIRGISSNKRDKETIDARYPVSENTKPISSL